MGGVQRLSGIVVKVLDVAIAHLIGRTDDAFCY
jgi:hypothetical protein